MPNILIVEDDRAILKGLEQNLRFEGYEVISATDGERGLTLARDKVPDLIILDIMLPKLNGYEVCRILRREGMDVPILMLTAKKQEMDKVMGLDLGLVNHVTTGISTGAQYGAVGLVDSDFVGFQNNLVNATNGKFDGFQLGIVNYAKITNGFQLGFVNYAESMRGLQIGVVNIIQRGGAFPVFPIVNWSF